MNANLIGRPSTVVPGNFGNPVTVEYARYSAGNANAAPRRPLFLCLHGWGSNEDDLADIMRYIAPYNDFVALRAPLVLQPASPYAPGAYSWFHDAVPQGDDLDYDAFAAATAVDQWVEQHIDEDRQIIPLGFSQGALVAVHLLRVHPERYTAAIPLSGFVAPGNVAGTAPADDRLDALEIPVFYGYGEADTVLPKPTIYAAVAWLSEHTWLTDRSYRGLDHSVSMQELADVNRWLLDHGWTSGLM